MLRTPWQLSGGGAWPKAAMTCADLWCIYSIACLPLSDLVTAITALILWNGHQHMVMGDMHCFMPGQIPLPFCHNISDILLSFRLH